MEQRIHVRKLGRGSPPRRGLSVQDVLPLVIFALVGCVVGYLLGYTARAEEVAGAPVSAYILPPGLPLLSPPEDPVEPAEPALVSLGEFEITHYCCERYKHICGTGDGLTATGIEVAPGIVAVDPEVIPLGSTVVIDGVEYLAADTGGAIKGKKVDIAVPTHQEALELGVRSAEVWVMPDD